MIYSIKKYFFEPKSKIGWVHGVVTVIGAIVLSYLTMMTYSSYAFGDSTSRIIPSMMITPILISLYSFWLLFSKSIIKVLGKFFIMFFFLILVLKIS